MCICSWNPRWLIGIAFSRLGAVHLFGQIGWVAASNVDVIRVLLAYQYSSLPHVNPIPSDYPEGTFLDAQSWRVLWFGNREDESQKDEEGQEEDDG